MDAKSLKNILPIALLTAVGFVTLHYLLTIIQIRHNAYSMFGYQAGYYVVNFAVPLLLLAIAAVPSFIVLQRKNAAHYLALTLSAVVLAFCFLFTFTPLIFFMGMYPLTSLLGNLALIVVAYLLADFIFNKWNTLLFKYKIMIVIAIALCTLAIDRLASFLLY